MCGEGTTVFSPSVKCCTFTPALPNFLLGQLLRGKEAEGEEGRRRLRAALEQGRVSPLGIAPTAAGRLVYQHAGPAFGRSPELACPWLDNQGCSIWSARNAVCATWFCKHGRGAKGQDFWLGLRRLLSAAEDAVARACVLALDPGEDALAVLDPPTREHPDLALTEQALAGRVDPDSWGRWRDREEAFLLACAELADGMDPKAVATAGGSRLALLLAMSRRTWARHCAVELPTCLTAAPFTLEPGSTSGLRRLAAYSELDPLEVPMALIGALEAFDGQPVEAALATLETQGTPLSLDLVALLVDFGVLVPA